MKTKQMKKTFVLALAAAGAAFASPAEASDYATRDIFTDGEFFVGCNYWAKNAGMYMWSRWSPETVEREVAELAKHGTRVMRVFPLWSDFQPLTGDCRIGGSYRTFRFRDNRPLPNPAGVDDEMIARFRFLCDVAQKNDVKLIVGIVTGWMSGRQFVPEVFEEKNVLSDPEAIRWQTKFVRYFVEKLKDHPAIAAWDYGNECNCLGAGDAGQAAFYNWMDHLAMAIRAIDPTRPVVSGMHSLRTEEDAAANVRQNGEICDVLCTHPYCFYVPGCGKEAFNTMRTILHPTAESVLYRSLGGKPCFVEEIGNLGTSCTSDERTAAGIRATLFSAWANDLKGLLWWCNSDQEVLDFPPYSITPCERELGMLRQDYTPKPVMLEMKAFQDFRATLPFRKLPKAKTDAVIVVPEKIDGWIPGFGAYLLARQAGFNPTFAGAEEELPDAGLYILCSGETDLSYTFPAQKRFYAKVAAGATGLVLYDGDMRLSLLREHAGVKVDYCTLSPCERDFSLAAHPGRTMNCRDKTTARLLPGDAEVLGRTTDGEPAFTRFKLGKGQMLVCVAPLDRQAVERTDVLTGARIQPYYLVFREAAKAAGLRHVVEKGDCPYVVFTEHPVADGSTVVVAINCEPREMECPISVNGTLGRVWRGDVTAKRVKLAANEAAVFEVK
jgi:beta-galactosidase